MQRVAASDRLARRRAAQRACTEHRGDSLPSDAIDAQLGATKGAPRSVLSHAAIGRVAESGALHREHDRLLRWGGRGRDGAENGQMALLAGDCARAHEAGGAVRAAAVDARLVAVLKPVGTARRRARRASRAAAVDAPLIAIVQLVVTRGTERVIDIESESEQRVPCTDQKVLSADGRGAHDLGG